jgi:hypothetical protein
MPIRELRSQKEETPQHSTSVMAEIFSKRYLTSDAGHKGIWTFHASYPLQCRDAKHQIAVGIGTYSLVQYEKRPHYTRTYSI